MINQNETKHGQASNHDLHVVSGSRGQFFFVVARDSSAKDYPPALSHVEEGFIEDGSTDVVEEQAGAVREFIA